jgi:hypothetical protein
MPDTPTSPLPAAPAFEQLRELTRNGYVADEPGARGASVRLRHAHAPDLVLHADGRLELPLGQPEKPRAPSRTPWLRIALAVVLATAFWFLSVFATTVLLFSGS